MKLEVKTNKELLEMQRQIEEDPANASPEGSLFRFVPKAQKKLDSIARQITHNLAVARAAAGNPVPCDGYSGRQSKRGR